MLSMHQILYSLLICLLLQSVISQERPELSEEYIDEELPESAAPDAESAGKPVNETNDGKQKAKFADDRFTQLFQPRSRNQPKPSSFFPKFASKAKPTLPPFIKRTPPIVRATPSTVSPLQNQRQRNDANQRGTTTQRTTTTRTPSRGSNNNNGNNRRNNNQINNRQSATTTSTTSAPNFEASGRRRFGSSSDRRLRANGTIPATTNRPNRRN